MTNRIELSITEHFSFADGDEIFDGILPHVAGVGRMWLNHRFANADVSGGQQYEDHFNPADAFPFSSAETTDDLT